MNVLVLGVRQHPQTGKWWIMDITHRTTSPGDGPYDTKDGALTALDRIGAVAAQWDEVAQRWLR